MGGAPPALVARDLGWTYRGRSRPALQGLSFALEPAASLLVIGPSGGGKSTLARALAGLLPHVLPGAWTGSLTVGDLDLAAAPPGRLGELAGIVFQDPSSQLVMARVEDEVAFGLENRAWPRDAMLRRVPEALAAVGLEGYQDRSTARLSGGEQQRLAIAAALAPRPGLIVLDEPTAHLDPPAAAALFETLAAIVAGGQHTVVVIEHRVDEALPLAEAVLALDAEGRQVAFGRPEDVAHRRGLLARLGTWLPRAWSPGLSGTGRGPGADTAGDPDPRPPTKQSTPPVLEARGLVVRYPADGSCASPSALDGVSLRLWPGERVALVGPNGSGKSTLLFTLAGLRRPDAGAVGVGDGLSPPDQDPARLPASRLGQRLGLVFQQPEFGFVGRTVAAEAAGLPGRDGARAAADPAVTALLERFVLDGLAGEDPFRLSQGEQRRLGIAAASRLSPALLLLDEPTLGLDRATTEAVLALLDGSRAEGQGQLIATHELRLLPACDRVIALEAGRVAFDGPVREFLDAPPYRPAAPWRLPAALAAAS